MNDLLTYSRKPVTQMPEGDLIVEAQKDPRNFEPLYNKYYHQIFRFVISRVGDKESAADVTSQVFLKALVNIQNFKYKGLPLSSWLYRIAINECNEYFRNNKKRQCILLDEKNVETLSEELNLFEEEARIIVEKLIQSLKPVEIQLIELRFFESLPFVEVGRVLGITENNAKVKLYRVLDKMRKKMNVI